MSNDAGGFGQAGPPPPGYPPPGYPPPGYPGYPPPGYQGYPPPGYQGYPPPGYPGYPPARLSPAGLRRRVPPALKPGVIPLRPLTLTDILNGAIAYIRTNPKATLGLTTVVVVIAQIIALILQVGPLAATGRTRGAAWRGGVDGRGPGFVRLRPRRRDHHAAVVDPAQRHADGHRGPGGVRRGHHHRRGMAAGPRATARSDRLHPAVACRCARHHRGRRVRRRRRRGRSAAPPRSSSAFRWVSD